jgi:hypothetical protein
MVCWTLTKIPQAKTIEDMKIVIFVLFGFAPFLCASDKYEAKFQRLEIMNRPFRDLCSGTSYSIPVTTKNIKLWSVHCTNCKWQIEDAESLSDVVLINVDRQPDRLEACTWIKMKNIKALNLSDSDKWIKTQLGSDFPIPVSLFMSEGKIDKVSIGYWRK